MRCQTQHDHRTWLLREETKHVKKCRMKLGKEPHAAREPPVGHPLSRHSMTNCKSYLFVCYTQQQIHRQKLFGQSILFYIVGLVTYKISSKHSDKRTRSAISFFITVSSSILVSFGPSASSCNSVSSFSFNSLPR